MAKGAVRPSLNLSVYLKRQLKCLPQNWIIIIYILTLSILSVRNCFLPENCNCLYTQAERSQYFLYSKYLNNGHPETTFNTRETTPQTNIKVISTQFVILLLLAGDIELNPGPTPTISTPDITQTTVPVQHTTTWTWPTHLLGRPLGAVGLVGFPRLGPDSVPVCAPRTVDPVGSVCPWLLSGPGVLAHVGGSSGFGAGRRSLGGGAVSRTGHGLGGAVSPFAEHVAGSVGLRSPAGTGRVVSMFPPEELRYTGDPGPTTFAMPTKCRYYQPNTGNHSLNDTELPEYSTHLIKRK